jgi:hypothetical protein
MYPDSESLQTLVLSKLVQILNAREVRPCSSARGLTGGLELGGIAVNEQTS